MELDSLAGCLGWVRGPAVRWAVSTVVRARDGVALLPKICCMNRRQRAVSTAARRGIYGRAVLSVKDWDAVVFKGRW